MSSSPPAQSNTTTELDRGTAIGPVKHFIITRFNLRSLDPSSAKMIDEAYLAQRLDLFERFCLPTIRHQTHQGFKWLVLFADDTPAKARARIEAYGADWPNFVPVWLPQGSSSVGRLVIGPLLDGSPQTLITTRLDNDDGLARDYIEKVRRHEATHERLVLQFPVGYCWHNERIYRDRQEHNAFTTLIEPLPLGNATEYNTIYKGSHSDIARLGRVIDVDEEPSWLQVIHGGNLENYLRGRRERIGDLPRHFDVKLPKGTRRENGLEIAFDRIRTFATSTMTRVVRSVKYRLGLYDDIN
jgi:hypothetical protein